MAHFIVHRTRLSQRTALKSGVRFFSFVKNSSTVLPIFSETGLQLSYEKARGFVQNNFYPVSEVTKWEDDYIFPAHVFKAAAKGGYCGMFVTNDYNGQSYSRKESCVIIEALATGCVGTTSMLCVHNMCASMLNSFGNAEQKDQWLRKLTSFDMMASYCITEPNSGSDAASLITSAKVDNDTNEYVVNGSKVFISGAGVSDIYFVMVRTGNDMSPGSVSCLVIPKDTKGVIFGKNEKKMGLKCTPTRQVIFDNVRVPAANRLGKEGHGFKIAMAGLDGGRLSIGASSLGAAQAALELLVEHVRKNPSIKSQMLEFTVADMAGKIMTARMMLQEAATLLDSKSPAAIAHCALAKKIATDTGFEVANAAYQLLGEEQSETKQTIERFLRGTRVHSIVEGTNEIMRHILGKQLVA